MSEPQPNRWVPFSNGSEYMGWRARNCERCAKDWDRLRGVTNCALEESLSLGAIIDGSIPTEVRDRIGWTSEPYEHLTDCKEIEVVR